MSDINDLVRALRQNDAESLDVPHPARIKNVMVTPLTTWVDSRADSDYEYDQRGRATCAVKGQIRRIEHLDDYHEPIGEVIYDMMHKFGTPERQSKDESSSRITPESSRGLRLRFPEAFEQFEQRMERDGTELPIQFLDDVPPEVLKIIKVMGAHTIRDFAEFDAEQMQTLVQNLNDHKFANRARFADRYRQTARDRVGLPGNEPDARAEPAETAPKRKPGRPPKDQQAAA